MNKKELRKKFKAKRADLMKGYSLETELAIFNNLTSLIKSGFKFIGIFYPHGSELNLLNLSKHLSDEIRFFFPVVKGQNQMEYIEWQNQGWVSNKYGIKEPVQTNQQTLLVEKETLIITPCLSANSKGYRLGYGGGYYDRFIKNFPLGTYAACLLEEMIDEEIPIEPHDQRVQFIVTDQKVRECY